MLVIVIVVVLGTTVIVGTTLGGRYRVAPPVLLLRFGALLALVPGLTDVELDPEVVLFLFLPAILYWRASTRACGRSGRTSASSSSTA